MRYPFEVNLVGDAAATLRRAASRCSHRKDDRSWRETVEKNVRAGGRSWNGAPACQADPVNPELVFHELSPRLPDDAILTADSGSGTNWYARHVRIRGDNAGHAVRHAGHHGLRRAVRDRRQVRPSRSARVALVGDGAMQMNGINELITIAKYWQDWADPRLVVAVMHNSDLNQVTWELRAMGGRPVPALPAAAGLPATPTTPAASAWAASTVEKPEDSAAARWDQALAADRPCVVEFVTDPSRPADPAACHLGPAGKGAESVVRGDSDRVNVIKEGIKSKGAGVPAQQR